MPALLLFSTLTAAGRRTEGTNELPAIIARSNGTYTLLVDGKPVHYPGDPALEQQRLAISGWTVYGRW